MPNISVALGNNTWTWTDSTAVTHTYVIPDGLYGVDDLNDIISSFLVDEGEAANTFVISGIDATQHTSIQVNAPIGTSINFSTNTVGTGILGFTVAQSFTTIQTPDIVTSADKATFNKIDNVLFNLSICNGSIYNGFVGTQVVMKADLLGSSGDQIVTTAVQLVDCDVTSREIDQITLRLTDNTLSDIDLRGENFSLSGYIEIGDEHGNK